LHRLRTEQIVQPVDEGGVDLILGALARKGFGRPAEPNESTTI
jgi:hypothetical protein